MKSPSAPTGLLEGFNFLRYCEEDSHQSLKKKSMVVVYTYLISIIRYIPTILIYHHCFIHYQGCCRHTIRYTMVVFGMRLIRRPWKGCQFWDVPFTIPWKGCKFQKSGLRKWGYRIWFFWVFNMLHMLSDDHQGGWGWGVGGWGGCINVLDEHFLYVTEDAHVAHAVVWSSGGVGGVY